ncbi:MAG: lipid A deacylase LpxR family protein [Opitutaceae bacterium]|nr:lipid A deacylase LpxR family protein [Opitutaceae bacterium]
MKTHRFTIAFACFALGAIPLAAQDDPAAASPSTETLNAADTQRRARNAGVLSIYFENDYFGGTDRHYTNGAKISYLSGDLATWGADGWRRSFVEMLPFVNRPDAQKNFGFALGQNIYTPQDTDAIVPDPQDRPYAGWTYVELSFVSKTDTVMDTLSFQVGMIGPHSYADTTQRHVHEWINDSRPNGWEYQLEDELGVNVVYERNWRLYARALNRTLGFDFIPHLGASLGNVQTHANAGGTVRLGLNLPSDFGVKLIRPGGTVPSPIDDTDPRVAPDRDWSLFVFASVDGRAVARDIFLDGNTWEDSPSVDKEPLVADLSYGAGLIAGRWQLTFAQTCRTREFKNQPEDFNEFGSLNISRAF